MPFKQLLPTPLISNYVIYNKKLVSRLMSSFNRLIKHCLLCVDFFFYHLNALKEFKEASDDA